MVLNFVVNQAMYLALARGDAAPLREALDVAAGDPRGLPVGELRPQPRRADARQALRGRARGGVRRVRPRPGAAALRPRAAPAAADDARRRRAPHPHALLLAFSLPGHAGAVLRRGDRHGARTSRSRAARACARRCSGRRSRTAASRPPRTRRALPPGRRRGGLGAGARQRRRPAPRPGLAAELDGAPDPPPPRVPGARLGRVHAARRRPTRRCSPTARTGTAARSSRCTRSRSEPLEARLDARATASRRPVDLFGDGRPRRRGDGDLPSRSSPTATAGSGCAARGSALPP